MPFGLFCLCVSQSIEPSIPPSARIPSSHHIFQPPEKIGQEREKKEAQFPDDDQVKQDNRNPIPHFEHTLPYPLSVFVKFLFSLTHTHTHTLSRGGKGARETTHAARSLSFPVPSRFPLPLAPNLNTHIVRHVCTIPVIPYSPLPQETTTRKERGDRQRRLGTHIHGRFKYRALCHAVSNERHDNWGTKESPLPRWYLLYVWVYRYIHRALSLSLPPKKQRRVDVHGRSPSLR